MRDKGVVAVLLLLCTSIFYWHAHQYEYIQDDAYISLVYAQNLIEGNGLVFNANEFVEGYTNFLWTLLLSIPLLLHIDPVRYAQVLGELSESIAIASSQGIARHLVPKRHVLWSFITPLLLASNGALGFWALCGLETTFFTLLLTAGALTYTREIQSGRIGNMPALFFALATLTRPEGIAFYGLTVMHRAAYFGLIGRFSLVEQLRTSLPFALLVGAQIIFRYVYYDALLPNTFYAKTGWDVDHIERGLVYAHAFVVGYGLWGGVFVGPILLALFSQARPFFSYVALLTLFNGIYVVVIGGDVWSECRFFMPLLPLHYMALQELLFVFGNRLSYRSNRSMPLGIISTIFVLVCYNSIYAAPSLKHSQASFIEHNRRLEEVARYILQLEEMPQTVATSTIGIIKYRTGVRVVDILGLTDAHVARYPELLPGVVAAQNDVMRKYNVSYVLDQKPDMIFFLTGLKPIKAAEKALYVSERFLRNYYAAYISSELPIFVLDVDSEFAGDTFHNARFVEHYIAGTNAMSRDLDTAISELTHAIDAAPNNFPYAHQRLGVVEMQMGREADAMVSWHRAIQIDGRCVKALANLSIFYVRRGQLSAAAPLAMRAVQLSPYSQLVQMAAGMSVIFSDARLALEHLKKASAMPGINRSEATFFVGLAHKQLGELQQARDIWETLLNENPQDNRLRKALDSL